MAQPLAELGPLVEALRDGPALDLTAPVQEIRAQADAGLVAIMGFVRPAGELHEVTDVDLGEVALRVYRPTAAATGVHVHLHGGGWWMASIETADAGARELAASSGLVVVSVGYRLAPEAPWPAALEDAYAAVCWAAEQLHPTSLSVGGESAGGHLAAAVCLLLRERGGPTVVAQWLDVPALDLTFPDTPSMLAYKSGYGLEIEAVRPVLDWFVPADQRRDGLVSPLLADDLTGLPPAIITTAELDPLCDQGTAYAEALRSAGVTVEQSTWEGHLHATMWLTGLTASGAQWHDAVVAALVRRHDATTEVAA